MTVQPPPPPPPLPPPGARQVPERRTSSPLAAFLIVGAVGMIVIAAAIVAVGIVLFNRSRAQDAAARNTPVEAPPVAEAPVEAPALPVPAEPPPPYEPAAEPPPRDTAPEEPSGASPAQPRQPARSATASETRRRGVDRVEGGRPDAPPPPPPRAIRPGGTIAAPTKLRNVNPVYPQIAQSARVQGVVIIEATIGTDGKVTNAKVLRSIPLLDQAALDAVQQWEYTPTLLDGEPVPVIVTVTVNFTLH